MPAKAHFLDPNLSFQFKTLFLFQISVTSLTILMIPRSLSKILFFHICIGSKRLQIALLKTGNRETVTDLIKNGSKSSSRFLSQ